MILCLYSDKDWSLMAVFDNTTEIKKLIDLADELPGYVDILLQTMLEPEKVCSSKQSTRSQYILRRFDELMYIFHFHRLGK